MSAANRETEKPLLKLATSLLCVASLSFGGMAIAQPGDGINLGPTKTTPHLGVSFEIDGNPLQASTEEKATGDLKSLVSLGLNPGFVSEMKNSWVKARVSYDHYTRTGLNNPDMRKALSYYDNFTGRLGLDFFPKGQVGFSYRHNIRNHSSANQQATDNVEQLAQPDVEFGDGLVDRFYNDMGLTGRYSAGSALEFSLGANWFFEQNSASLNDLIFGKKNDLGVEAKAQWKFFPRTFVVAEFGLHSVGYRDADGTPTRDLGAWFARGGVTGQITSTIQAVGMIGAGGLNNKTAGLNSLAGADRVIGQGTLSWSPQENQSLSFSFVRSFGDYIIADYYVNNSLNFRYQGTAFDNRLEGSLGTLIDIREIDLVQSDADLEGLEGNNGEMRADTRIRFRAGLAYRVAPWLRTTASYTTTLLNSNDVSVQYTQHVLLLGVRGSY